MEHSTLSNNGKRLLMNLLDEVCEPICCPRCGSSSVIRYGKSHKKNQVYHCRDCGRYFVPKIEGFRHIRKPFHIIVRAFDLYFKGMSLRKVADYLSKYEKVSIHCTTVYRWLKNYVRLIGWYVSLHEPRLSGKWYADEMSLRIKGKWRWLWNIMDDETRFLLASIVSSNRETEDAVKVFRDAVNMAKSRPKLVITDGLPAYEDAVKKLFWSRKKEERTVYEKHVRLSGDLSTNPIERLHGTIRERFKVMRGIKCEDSFTIEGFKIYYNYVREHETLGMTPAEKAGLEFGKGRYAWLQLLLRATFRKIMEENSNRQDGIS